MHMGIISRNMISFSFCVFVLFGATSPIISGLNPETFMNTPQLIEHAGFPVESHYVTTEDGYILNIFRVPPKHPNSPVIFFQHGFAASSDAWVLNDAWGSFPLIAAERGYDVWLGNVRGNIYSINHTVLPVNTDTFWDFTFQEMAEKDLPAMLDAALSTSRQDKLFYIGHSQGTEIGFVEFSQNPRLAEKIQLFVALAPIARLSHIEGLLGLLAKSDYLVNLILSKFGERQIMFASPVSRIISSLVCTKAEIVQHFCEDLTALISGFDVSNVNQSRYDIYKSHSGDSTSAKNFLHWIQLHKAKEIQKFDYGNPAENLKYYNQTTPPLYDISNINVPVVLVAGGNDWLADSRDVLWLAKTIQQQVRKLIFVDKYNHLDYVSRGQDAPEKVYYPLLQIMQEFLV